MQRSKDIIGKAIVSAANGKRLGSVADLLLDGQRHCLVGLVVRDGWLAAERVLPYQYVKTVGRDAVIVGSDDGLLDRRGWGKRAVPSIRASRLKGRRVVTTAGRTIGALRDVFVDEQTGDIAGYEIAGRTGLLAPHSMLPRAGDVRIGPDAIVVPENTAPQGMPTRSSEHRPAEDKAS